MFAILHLRLLYVPSCSVLGPQCAHSSRRAREKGCNRRDRRGGSVCLGDRRKLGVSTELCQLERKL